MKKILLFILLALPLLVNCQDKQYSFVFLNNKPDAAPMEKEKVAKLMEGHMANITRLAKEGKLIAAGPFEGGGGMFILNTTSQDEAKQWLSTDPGVQANRWNIEILPYTVRLGAICAAQEPYEMVMYTFIRFNAVVTKSTASSYPEIIRKHTDYVKQLSNTGNVITAGVFGENEGGIVIMKGDVQREVMEADPGVQEGLLDFQIKKLWIAKGSFCEK